MSEIAGYFDRHFPLPVPARQPTITSPLLEPPTRTTHSPDYIPMDPTNPQGPVEMPVLADEPRGQKRKRCFKCKSTDHVVSQCPVPRKNKKCTKCGSIDHKTAKCRHHRRQTPEEGEIISPFAKAIQKSEMSLLDRISLLDKEQWFPEVCCYVTVGTFTRCGQSR